MERTSALPPGSERRGAGVTSGQQVPPPLWATLEQVLVKTILRHAAEGEDDNDVYDIGRPDLPYDPAGPRRRPPT
jgi:hypothetical protein